MKENTKVIIIGSGLGGLSSGVILAKNGYDVTILEKGAQIGGCLQCFTRHGAKFETGMHFIGSAAQGQTLNQLMRYLEIDQAVKLSQLDPQGYDVVSLSGKRYQFANGKEAFIKRMTEYFPDQYDNIVNYYNLVEEIANASSLHSLKYAESDAALNMEYQLRSVNEVIDEVITNPTLAKVLVGNLPLYAAEKDKTPFSTHAFIMDFYNQSAFRVKGGSDRIAFALENTLKRYGGEVLTKKKVTKMLCDNTHAIGVEVNDKEVIPCDIVISDTHPMRTLELLDTKLIRPAFRKRINQIPQTVGGFSVYYLAGHHNKRFKAFIAHDGAFNLESMYTDTEEAWFSNWEYDDAYWNKDQSQRAKNTYANSPHRFIDKWDTPILVIHGEKDYRINANQGMGAFNAARLRGIPAEMLLFPDENHWVLKPQNGILWQRTFFDWLDRWLKK